MSWTLMDDTPEPVRRWQATFTAAAPTHGRLPLALVTTPTVQVEGTFGGAAVEVAGSNSGESPVALHVFRHAALEAVLPVVWLHVELLDADADTLLRVTVAGRR